MIYEKRDEFVDNSELVARLLFYPQMVKERSLKASAFPMDELLERGKKTGASVDRCIFLKNHESLLRQKAFENSNSSSGRIPFGFCLGQVGMIRELKENVNFEQAFEIYPDKIIDNNPPKPWDSAHALIKKYKHNYTRANLRGVRDKLCVLFEKKLFQFEPNFISYH